jgi:polyisoprenoid-binding protein YceI
MGLSAVAQRRRAFTLWRSNTMTRCGRYSAAIGLCGMLAVGALADSQTFDFKDPKRVNTVYFLADSTVEPIMGLGSGVSGQITFDPADAAATTGELSVATDTLHTQNEKMTEALLGDDWLDAATHPAITFKITSVKEAKKVRDDVFELTAVGEFSCKGTTKELTVPIKAAYVKDGLSKRLRGRQGDILVLRADFTILRKDFGIKPDMGNDVVAEEIQIRASIAGAAAK